MDKEKQDYYFKKFGMYIDNAKSYVQISVGALILPITFIRQLTGNKDSPIVLDIYLKISWICFLLAIGTGLLYQWLAVRKVEHLIENVEANWFVRKPGYTYGVMQVTFYLGAIYFVISALTRL